MTNKNQDINLIKLKGLKMLNNQTDIKKIYSQKNLCGVNTKYAVK
ncbi:hypothetical protein C8E03_11369 [Lachnotalea glycerini]|uniref:Uncharacterized protein n=1 Tax=Lachnotalea glycerini TaxID=1763509 RepID=A0A318EI02_9FIRM|nr:hypothetical protein [Lachnotalea glycerini]PXV86284.1 hypothetical protein C8E03_11369 [Lachnotalea glycerini]